MLRLRRKGKIYVAILLNTNCSPLKLDNLDAKESSLLTYVMSEKTFLEGPLTTLDF